MTPTLKRKNRWIAKPPGLHVVFLGADGSGKSTVIEHICATLAGGFARTRNFHLRPRLGLSDNAKGSIVVDPHGQPPRNWFFCVLKVAYFLLDYTAGYVVKVLPARACNNLIVFDRYYHDLLVDPRRYRYGSPMWLARMIGKLIPKPDLWILLDAPPHILLGRKQEVTPEEAARQREAYLALAKKLRSIHIVDASQPLDAVVANVNEVIQSHMAERTRKSLGT